MAVNIALTAMQMAVGYIAHSPNLMTDAMHTIDAENDFGPSLRGGKLPGREVLMGQLEAEIFCLPG